MLSDDGGRDYLAVIIGKSWKKIAIFAWNDWEGFYNLCSIPMHMRAADRSTAPTLRGVDGRPGSLWVSEEQVVVFNSTKLEADAGVRWMVRHYVGEGHEESLHRPAKDCCRMKSWRSHTASVKSVFRK